MRQDRTHKITVAADGPYLVEGGVKPAHQHIVTNELGESIGFTDRI